MFKFIKNLMDCSADTLAHQICTERFRSDEIDACRINSLVSMAENIGHLKIALKNGHPSSRISHMIDYCKMLNKWFEFARTSSDLREMKECWWSRLDNDTKIFLLRKWYALATTLDDINDTPETQDAMLNELVVIKRRKIVSEALQNASTCQELVSVCLKIHYEDEPARSLRLYNAWPIDSEISLADLKALHEKYKTTFRKDVSVKWLSVSKREIAKAQSLKEIRSISREYINPETKVEYLERWDVLAMKEVKNASTIDGLNNVVENCREGSNAKSLAYEKLDNMYCDLLQKDLEENVLIDLGWNDQCPKSAERATEKLVDLATTEEQMRSVWSLTHRFPNARERLVKKLDPLIK